MLLISLTSIILSVNSLLSELPPVRLFFFFPVDDTIHRLSACLQFSLPAMPGTPALVRLLFAFRRSVPAVIACSCSDFRNRLLVSCVCHMERLNYLSFQSTLILQLENI